jgi:hypothetical protein
MAIVDIVYSRDPQTGQVLFDQFGYPVYGSNPNANTYGQLQARVQNEVLGSPTTTDIQNAIQDAIEEYSRETFDFNRMRFFAPSATLVPLLDSAGNVQTDTAGNVQYDTSGASSNATLTTVQGKEFYSNVDLPVLVNYPHITKVLVLAFANRYPLIQRTPQWIDDVSLSTSWEGLPTDWAWDSGSLRIYPIPNGGYPLIIDATIRFAPMVNPSDFSVWTNRAEALIRTEAKRLLFINIIRDAGQAQAMELELMGNPATGRQGALAMVRREATRRAGGPGKLRASRAYF